MSGSTLRRTVLCLVLVALLLPLASAYAAPARSRENARIQLPEWSRILLASRHEETCPTGHRGGTMTPKKKPGNDGLGSSTALQRTRPARQALTGGSLHRAECVSDFVLDQMSREGRDQEPIGTPTETPSILDITAGE